MHEKPAVDGVFIQMKLMVIIFLLGLVWIWNDIVLHVKYFDEFHFQTTLMYIASLSSLGVLAGRGTWPFNRTGVGALWHVLCVCSQDS